MSLLTIFVVRLNHHKLFAGPGRTLKGSQGPPHQLHFCFHRREGSKDFFHSLSILQGLISLEEFLHVQIHILLTRWGWSSCPVGVPSSLPPALPDRQGLNHCCRGSLEVAQRGEREVKGDKAGTEKAMMWIIGCTHRESGGAGRAWISSGTNNTLKNRRGQNFVSIMSHLEPLSHYLAEPQLYPGRYGCCFIGLSSFVHQHSVVKALALKTHYSGFHNITHTRTKSY